MPRPTTRFAAACALVAALLAPLPALSALGVRASVEELARTSDAVVRGRVAARVARRAGTRIYTEVTVRAADVWRGGAAAEVTVRVPGGVVGNLGQRVDGAPAFEDGEEVVVFLSQSYDGAFRVNGLAQGKFRVDGALAAPDLSQVTFVQEKVAAGERGVAAMPLAELERRVREAR